jgi:hypothetical protein
MKQWGLVQLKQARRETPAKRKKKHKEREMRAK